jgi:hypothetical protein
MECNGNLVIASFDDELDGAFSFPELWLVATQGFGK